MELSTIDRSDACEPVAAPFDARRPEPRSARATSGPVLASSGRASSIEGRPATGGRDGAAETNAGTCPARRRGDADALATQRAAAMRAEARSALGERLGVLDDPAEIAFAAAEILGQALQVSRAGYGTIDPAVETITIERDWNAAGIASLAGVLHFRDYGTYIEELKRGETVVIEDIADDPRTAADADALIAISAQSFVNMPVSEQGGLVGLLYLAHHRPRRWTADELAFVREVGDRTRGAVARRIAEHQLRALAASLETQVAERTRERDRTWNNSQDLLVVVDRDGLFTAVNPAWTSLLGWRADELVGHHHTEFIHPDDRTPSDAALDNAIVTDLPRYENRLRHRNGSYRWFAWVASPEEDRVYASGRHVTVEKEAALELERAQEQLRQSQKMEAVGQLTGGLAHDFNNLLTGVSGSLELIDLRIAQGRAHEIGRYVKAAQDATKRAAALTHRLLAFSRRQTLDPTVVDVDRLIGDMEDLVRRTVGPSIVVDVVGTPGSWATSVDANQLENALLNLCINARDAMPDGGRLTIATSNERLDDRAARACDLVPGAYVVLRVSDSGTGMPPEVAARVFDPFFTTKPLGVGTGLGLSMVYGFARQTGGQVRIQTAPGSGTTMRVYLPRHCGAAESAVPEAADDAARVASPTGKVVLIVDDEATVRMLVADVVDGAGLTALEASDGESALEILRSDACVDLLVTDVGLPGGLDGRQVADAARLLRPGLEVLFITGYAEAAVGNGQLDRAMNVLTKPFALNVLEKRIVQLVEPD